MNTPTPCQTRPDVDWHADNTKGRDTAAHICRSCPIQLECAQDAIARRERWGVWGGFDFEDITQTAPERERRWAQGATPRVAAECGTSAGVNRHYRAGERPCRECLDALNARRAAKRVAA